MPMSVDAAISAEVRYFRGINNWEYIRRNLTPCSRTHFATLEVFLFYYCLALPEYKQAHAMWQVVAVNFHLSFITVVFIR